MVGAAVRKPRVPNDKLHRVTDNRLAEADRKVLHGVCQWSRLARYGGLPVLRALKVRVAILSPRAGDKINTTLNNETIH